MGADDKSVNPDKLDKGTDNQTSIGFPQDNAKKRADYDGSRDHDLRYYPVKTQRPTQKGHSDRACYHNGNPILRFNLLLNITKINGPVTRDALYFYCYTGINEGFQIFRILGVQKN